MPRRRIREPTIPNTSGWKTTVTIPRETYEYLLARSEKLEKLEKQSKTKRERF